MTNKDCDFWQWTDLQPFQRVVQCNTSLIHYRDGSLWRAECKGGMTDWLAISHIVTLRMGEHVHPKWWNKLTIVHSVIAQKTIIWAIPTMKSWKLINLNLFLFMIMLKYTELLCLLVTQCGCYWNIMPDNPCNIIVCYWLIVFLLDDTNEWTSWEYYNFILKGLVDELIGLGAQKTVKIVVLQLWATYLKKLEVAFTSKKRSRLPKLGINYHPR